MEEFKRLKTATLTISECGRDYWYHRNLWRGDKMVGSILVGYPAPWDWRYRFYAFRGRSNVFTECKNLSEAWKVVMAT